MTEATYPMPNRPMTIADLTEDETKGTTALRIFSESSAYRDHPEIEMLVLKLRTAMKRTGDFEERADYSSLYVDRKITDQELAEKLRSAQCRYAKGAAIYYGPMEDMPEEGTYGAGTNELRYFLKREDLEWPTVEDQGEYRLAQLALATGPTEPEDLGAFVIRERAL